MCESKQKSKWKRKRNKTKCLVMQSKLFRLFIFVVHIPISLVIMKEGHNCRTEKVWKHIRVRLNETTFSFCTLKLYPTFIFLHQKIPSWLIWIPGYSNSRWKVDSERSDTTMARFRKSGTRKSSWTDFTSPASRQLRQYWAYKKNTKWSVFRQNPYCWINIVLIEYTYCIESIIVLPWFPQS